MTRAHYDLCNREDKRILFTLLKINSKTNYYTVLWELDMLPFESILKREKGWVGDPSRPLQGIYRRKTPAC